MKACPRKMDFHTSAVCFDNQVFKEKTHQIVRCGMPIGCIVLSRQQKRAFGFELFQLSGVSSFHSRFWRKRNLEQSFGDDRCGIFARFCQRMSTNIAFRFKKQQHIRSQSQMFSRVDNLDVCGNNGIIPLVAFRGPFITSLTHHKTPVTLKSNNTTEKVYFNIGQKRLKI